MEAKDRPRLLPALTASSGKPWQGEASYRDVSSYQTGRTEGLNCVQLISSDVQLCYALKMSPHEQHRRAVACSVIKRSSLVAPSFPLRRNAGPCTAERSCRSSITSPLRRAQTTTQPSHPTSECRHRSRRSQEQHQRPAARQQRRLSP